jgi:pimeloyl-ACP methyl ester carboxylesterase
MRPIHFAAGGRSLAGRVFGPATARAGILFVHGIDSSQSGYWERAEAAVEQLGAVCLTFDLGGHGQSAGSRPTLSIRDHLLDVTAAYDRLVDERDVDPGRVGVAGASYGGYLATLLTAHKPVARLALRAPALYDDAELDVPRASRSRSHEPPAASAALEALARFHGAVLIVESEHDEFVAPATIRAYRAARADAEHVLIADAGHELSRPEWRTAFLTALLDFFAEL